MPSHDKLLAERREAFQVKPGRSLDLTSWETRDPNSAAIGKAEAGAILEGQVARLAAQQERLYADRHWSVLLILQAMDAGGKDGTIKHVLSGVNPQGLSVVSFKAPGPEELAHDFLWRIHRALPARGIIGVFNRSHYEEVTVARVHPDLLAAQSLPAQFIDTPDFWAKRLEDIRAFESYLARQGTRIVKVFLHVGQEEQKQRLRARLDDPSKLWKFDANDLRERALWPQYLAAYSEALAATSTPEAPWFVVPADQKWFARMAVADILLAALDGLHLHDPEPTPEQIQQVAAWRRALE